MVRTMLAIVIEPDGIAHSPAAILEAMVARDRSGSWSNAEGSGTPGHGKREDRREEGTADAFILTR